MRGLRPALFAALFLTGAAQLAAAQGYLGRDVPARGSWEAGGGVVWTGGFDPGDATARLTRSDPSAGAFDLFSVESRLDGAPGVQARVAFYVSRALALEAGFVYAQPKLSLRVSGDAEGAADTTAAEALNHYLFDGSLVLHLTRASFAGGRGIPFVSGGAGYVRDLHEGKELVETGTEYHAGGGLKYWLGDGTRRFGVRVEGGFTSREGGFDFQDERRTTPVAGASLIYLF